MLGFIVRRLFQAVLVMLVVALIAFTLFNFVGDPINSMVGQDTSLADRERLRQELGLNHHSWGSQLLLAVSLVGVSLPTFLIGILLILVFAVLLGWLPSFGRGAVVHIGWWTTGLLTLDGWRAII